ncbi:hypothetical protein AC579_3894 [Pseudocercospora musae]|uniref:Uncharacterized protein n=1 Tax=Pseudocercospora musae TaxID=113226 RepID=A0A139I352_9PEZI|nr:hypothetical protein AC579_3894 [Pseudocercospora musae]
MARGRSEKKRGATVLLQQFKPRQRSPSLDGKPLLDANSWRIPDEPPKHAYDPAPNSYAIAPTPVQDLPAVSDVDRELRPKQHGSNPTKDQVVRSFNPVAPRYGDRWCGANHTIRSPRPSKFRRWMSVIIPLLIPLFLLSFGSIVIACMLYRNQHSTKCVRLNIEDSKNVQCGDDVSSGTQPIPKCHGLPMMRIGNASAEFEGQVWKAWTYAYAFGEETFACTSLNGWWECREVGCEGEECERFGNVCASKGEEGKEDGGDGGEDEEDDFEEDDGGV